MKFDFTKFLRTPKLHNPRTIARFQQDHPWRNLIVEGTVLSPHNKAKADVPSCIVPGMMVDGATVFTCPSCKAEKQGGLDHGELYLCGCGNLYEAYGNHLGIGRVIG